MSNELLMIQNDPCMFLPVNVLIAERWDQKRKPRSAKVRTFQTWPEQEGPSDTDGAATDLLQTRARLHGAITFAENEAVL